jgi:diphosphomevalonate decarboxylase
VKATATSPSNIAFIKYWGNRHHDLRLCWNDNISMNLSNMLTTTTVEFSGEFKNDSLEIAGNQVAATELARVVNVLDLIRKKNNISHFAKVASKNSFPIGTGLSSSASAFAALALAASAAAGLKLSEKELSILARRGSGSACRSIPSGFTRWLAGCTDHKSFAVSVYPSSYWKIVDVVVLVSNFRKDIGSTDGHKIAHTSPFLKTRLKNLPAKIAQINEFIKTKNFEKFGELVESEALELHAIMITSTPSLIYLTPESIRLMKQVQSWRKEGIPVYFTLNTGQDVHLICEQNTVAEITKKLRSLDYVKDIIENHPCAGAHLVENHLF